MAIYINDVKIETDPAYGRRFRVEYNGKSVFVARHPFNHLHDKMEHNHLYKFIVCNLFNEKPNMMYDEYFGSDLCTDNDDTKLNLIPSYMTEKQNNDRNSKTKLGITFWGALIVEDILDDDDTNIKFTLPLTHDITW